MSLPRIIRALLKPQAYEHPVDMKPQLVQTHISWVILTGRFAYKIKKPVKLDFVDFSTLDRREHFCREELRLNRRLAPELYLAVVPITGDVDCPSVAGDGEPIEFAVRMKQFPQESLVSDAIVTGRLRPTHIDALATTVARFHREINFAGASVSFGSPVQIFRDSQENFDEFRKLELSQGRAAQIAELWEWSLHQLQLLERVFLDRTTQGFIRECHGDMHLNNMILDDDRITFFDCIEFNEAFRWIDVINETAFCYMDLEAHLRTDWAARFLNTYLEWSGDYGGLALLRFYAVYRALVRAKVSLIRSNQTNRTDAESPEVAEADKYFDLAYRLIAPNSPQLWITHGVSGSGKTFGTQSFVESQKAIRIRSDVERKRLAGMMPHDHSDSAQASHLYSTESTERTYNRLAELAAGAINAMYSVVVDATFLKQNQRELFIQLAAQLSVPIHILRFNAPVSVLRDRLVERMKSNADASEANVKVLEEQLRNQEPLAPEERAIAIEIS